VTLGEIKTSHYSDNQLYILGKENVDTDEYDDHVVAHEWGHYFESRFSRSDSLGDDHSIGDKLDPRVAFGEGLGNAISGMVTDDIHYVDTNGNLQGVVGVYMDLSSSSGDTVSVGWFSEDSVQYILTGSTPKWVSSRFMTYWSAGKKRPILIPRFFPLSPI
jgi:hypothetical protein